MFNLPKSSIVEKVIPKNAFDPYTNTKQKRWFAEKVRKIVWKNKIAQDTVNLKGISISEIHIFEIELKEKIRIDNLLKIIDRAIPYTIIFYIWYKEEYYLSTSAKHANPTNEDNAVIDYVFSTNWCSINEPHQSLVLENTLDEVFKKFCEQINNSSESTDTLNELISNNKKKDQLKYKIKQLESKIKKEKQFNRKVEFNTHLNQLKKELESMK